MLETDGLSKACESYDKTLRRAQLLPDAYVTRARFVRLAYAIVLERRSRCQNIPGAERRQNQCRFLDNPDGRCDHCCVGRFVSAFD